MKTTAGSLERKKEPRGKGRDERAKKSSLDLLSFLMDMKNCRAAIPLEFQCVMVYLTSFIKHFNVVP